MMSQLITYSQLIIPGLFLAGIILWALPKEQVPLRIFILLFCFILMRDSLVPSGLWKITNSLEMRFTGNTLATLVLAFSSLILAIFSGYLIGVEKFKLWKNDLWKGVLFGFLSSFLVVVPVYALRKLELFHPELPKVEELISILVVLTISFFGNFLEEILFRGHLQNYLEKSGLSRNRIIMISALTFTLCHVFLAFTVTQLGLPILVFTFYEGLICAWLATRFGVLSASLAHGFAIFWIATDLIFMK